MAGSDSADLDAFYTATVRRVLYLYAACGDRSEAAVAWRLMINRWPGLRRWLAARARMGPPDDATGSPSPDRVAIVGALQRLPPPQRQVSALHYLLDMSIRDIAASVGVPEGTVKARLSRARAALASGPGAATLLRAALPGEVTLRFDPERRDETVDLIVGRTFARVATTTELNRNLAAVGEPSPPPQCSIAASRAPGR